MQEWNGRIFKVENKARKENKHKCLVCIFTYITRDLKKTEKEKKLIEATKTPVLIKLSKTTAQIWRTNLCMLLSVSSDTGSRH